MVSNLTYGNKSCSNYFRYFFMSYRFYIEGMLTTQIYFQAFETNFFVLQQFSWWKDKATLLWLIFLKVQKSINNYYHYYYSCIILSHTHIVTASKFHTFPEVGISSLMNSEYISRKLLPGFYGLTLAISQTLRHYWQKRRMIFFTAPVQWGHGRSNLLLKSNMKYKHNHTWVFSHFSRRILDHFCNDLKYFGDLQLKLCNLGIVETQKQRFLPFVRRPWPQIFFEKKIFW